MGALPVNLLAARLYSLLHVVSVFFIIFFYFVGLALVFFIVYSLALLAPYIKRLYKKGRAIKLYIKGTSWQFLSHKVDANRRISHSVNNFSALHMVNTIYIIFRVSLYNIHNLMQNKSL